MEHGFRTCQSEGCERIIGIILPEARLISYNLCFKCMVVNALCFCEEDYNNHENLDWDWMAFVMN